MNDALITGCAILVSAGLFIAFIGMMLLFLHTNEGSTKLIECSCVVNQDSTNEITDRLSRIEGFIDAYLTVPQYDMDPP